MPKEDAAIKAAEEQESIRIAAEEEAIRIAAAEQEEAARKAAEEEEEVMRIAAAAEDARKTAEEEAMRVQAAEEEAAARMRQERPGKSALYFMFGVLIEGALLEVSSFVFFVFVFFTSRCVLYVWRSHSRGFASGVYFVFVSFRFCVLVL